MLCSLPLRMTTDENGMGWMKVRDRNVCSGARKRTHPLTPMNLLSLLR